MRLLLDTCTFLWLIGLPERLPDAICARVEDVETDCVVSLTTIWECLIKHGKGRLRLVTGERTALEFTL
jgi:PIN domain nuclease of toxin-antitoxin system